MQKQTFKNMEQIITSLKKNLPKVQEIRKYDGITIQIKVKSNRDACIKLVETFCRTNGIINYVIEKNKEEVDTFIVQFPEFIPEYTQKAIDKMYNENFQWLITNSLNSVIGNTIDKSTILNSTDQFVKHAIMIYYKSNTNQFKTKLEDLLKDTEYRYDLNNKFRNCVDEYWGSKKV